MKKKMERAMRALLLTEPAAPRKQRPQASRRRLRRNNIPLAPGMSSVGIPNQVYRQAPYSKQSKKNGHLCVSNEEPWGPVSAGNTQLIFAPGSSGLALLDNEARLYDQYKLIKCVIKYKTASGTTTQGDFVYGVDYNTKSTDISFNAVSLLEPKWVGPVWNNGTLTVNKDQAMKGMSWRYTGSIEEETGPAFQVLGVAQGPADSMLGRVWAEYEVEFCSPKRASTAPVIFADSAIGLVVGNTDSSHVVSEEPSVFTDPISDNTVETPASLNEQPTAGQEFLVALDVATEVTLDHGWPNNATPRLLFRGVDGSDLTDHFRIRQANFQMTADGFGGFWSWFVDVLKDVAIEVVATAIVSLVGMNGDSTNAKSATLRLRVLDAKSSSHIFAPRVIVTEKYAQQCSPICVAMASGDSNGSETYGAQCNFFNHDPSFTVTKAWSDNAFILNIKPVDDITKARLLRGVIAIDGVMAYEASPFMDVLQPGTGNATVTTPYVTNVSSIGWAVSGGTNYTGLFLWNIDVDDFEIKIITTRAEHDLRSTGVTVRLLDTYI